MGKNLVINNYSKLNSFKLIFSDIFITKVLKGNKFLYIYIKLLLYFNLIFPKFKFYDLLKCKNFIIENDYGKFYINSCNDSISMSSIYFEYYILNWLNIEKKNIICIKNFGNNFLFKKIKK